MMTLLPMEVSRKKERCLVIRPYHLDCLWAVCMHTLDCFLGDQDLGLLVG